MVVSIREFVLVIVGSLVVSVVILGAVWPWTRHARRMAAIALGAALGIIAWNVALNVTNAANWNVDSPFLGLSVQDVGSGVLAFVASALVLYFATDRREPLSTILGVSAVVGVVTIAVDLFA